MKKGFTLIELLVYMAIMGFIIVVAGKVFSDATGMRVRTQNMTKATETVNAAAKFLKEDLSRMGAKEYKRNSDSKFFVVEKVYRSLNGSDGDTSSFELTRANNGEYDEIVFNVMDFKNDAATSMGEFDAVREIRYSVNDKNLIRQCRTIEGSPNADCPDSEGSWDGVEPKVVIAANVTTFSLNPSIPGIPREDLATSIQFAKVPVIQMDSVENFSFESRTVGEDVVQVNPKSAANTSTSISLDGFASNDYGSKKYSQVLLANKTIPAAARPFKFVPGETYAVRFDLYYPQAGNDYCRMCMFQPGEDHIALGLRNTNFTELGDDRKIPDFTVYPPQIQTGGTLNSRNFEFSIPKKSETDTTSIEACISITFAFYSIYANSGTLIFDRFKVYRKTDKVYHFATGNDAYTYNPSVNPAGTTSIRDKAQVKAFELELSVDIKGEAANVKTVIPVPSNGVFAESSPLPI